LVYLLLVVLTVLSCILFEYSNLADSFKRLKNSYTRQFKVMSDKTISDEAKQKVLMGEITKQLILLGKLILGIFLFVAPFLSLFILERFWPSLNADILLSWYGIVIPILTAVIYILVKRYYGKLFKNG